MSGDSSEEKNLPPSEKKLQDARKKGQIAKAPDLASALIMLAMLGFVWAASDWILARLKLCLDLAAAAVLLPDGEGLKRLPGQILEAAAPLFIVPVALSAIAIIAAQVATNRGFIFATEPLKPKIENVDPFKGLKKLFGTDNWVELAKSLVQVLTLATVFALLVHGALGMLAQAGSCGMPCLAPILGAALRPILGAALGLMLLGGLVDLLLKRWLFIKQMRMSRTEMKRERKDQDGSPEMRGERSRLRREAVEAERLGLSRAVVLVVGGSEALGLRYVRGESDVPVVVCRGRGEAAAQLVARAREAGVPIFTDDALARGLFARARNGGRVPPEFFQAVARALFASGALR